MDEVSRRMFQFYVDLASVNGIPAEQLTEGLAGAHDLLSRRRKWLHWDEYVHVITRFEQLCGGPERAEEAFREGTFRQVVRPFNAVVSYFTTARAVYFAGYRWFAPSLYRHLRFDFHSVSEDTIRLVVELPEPHQPSEVFWRHWRGSMRFAPLQIGLPESQVTLSCQGRRAEYLIRLPERRKVMQRIVSWTRAIVRSTDVVDELNRHQQELRDAYEALVSAHQQSEEALRRSEETRRALLNALPDLIVVATADGTVQDVQGSPGHFLHAALSGARHLEKVAMFTSGGAMPVLLAHLREAATSQAIAFAEFSVSDGPLHFFESRACALDEDRVLMVIRDVSERKQMASQLLLSDRMASLGTLAAAVAHEINNPLAALLNNLELLAREDALVGKEYLRDAKEAGEQIREIVGQLRLFTRADRDELRPIDVNALLETMLRIAAHRIRHSATVVRSLGTVPLARADQARLGQVFVNLLVNAAQAMPDTNVARNEIQVRTGTTSSGEVFVEVRDNGCGIAPEHLPRIFDPFFTTRSLNEGTGLGLAICHRIVTDLGGRIEVKSEVGKGSSFSVLLPPAVEVKKEVEPPSAAPVITPARKLRILVIDDNPRLGLSLKLLLREHEVTVVQHGTEGVDRLLSEPFEFALCDLMMPDVNGMELYRRVEQARPGLAKRIIFMTGGAFTPDARAFLSSVPNTCLQKPFRAEDLEALLAQA